MESDINQPDLSPDQLAALRRAADETAYTTPDWLEALNILDAWIVAHPERARDLSFARRLGYLTCSAELGSRNPIRPALTEILDEMLNLYGYDG